MAARPLLLAGVAVGVAGLVGLPPAARHDSDFVEYMAAARLLLTGDNPYDWNRLLPVERAAGWEGYEADMMWNPPWVFPLLIPLGMLPAGAGHAAWTAAQFVAILAACRLAWTLYGGPLASRWVVVPLALLFAPTLTLLRLGQIGGFLLLGLVGFPSALRAGRPLLAGAALALLAIKPHLFLPVVAVLAGEAVRSPATRRAAVAGVGVLAAAAAFPLAWNAHVWADWRAALAAPGDALHYAPADWVLPTFGHRLRTAVGGGLWAQFVPSVAGVLAALGYWWRRRAGWDWAAKLPGLTLLSVLTTGYGAMGFDQVVLLLPVVRVAAGVADRRPDLGVRAMAGYIAGNAAALFLLIPVLWWAPAVLAGFLLAGRAAAGAGSGVKSNT